MRTQSILVPGSAMDSESKSASEQLPSVERSAVRQLPILWSQAVGAILLAVTLLCFAVALIYPLKSQRFEDYNVFLISMVSVLWVGVPDDVRRFLLWHKLFMVAMLIVSVALCLLPNEWKRRLQAVKFPAADQCIVLGLIVFLGACVGVSTVSVNDQVFGLIVVAGLAGCLFVIRRGSVVLAWVLASVTIGAACVIGLFLRPNLTGASPIEIVQMQQHYGTCIAFADQLTAGIPVRSSSPMHYGVLTPTIIGAVQRVTGILSWGDLIHLVQVLQVALLGTIFLLLTKLSRRSHYLALLAFLPIVPWYHAAQVTVSYPNQSGWRFLGVFLAFFAVTLCRKLPATKLALVLGLIAGVCTINNVETGIILTVALSLYWLLESKQNNVKAISVGASCFLGGFAAAVAAFTLAFLLLARQLPSMLNPVTVLNYMRAPDVLTHAGDVNPLAILMFVHAAYVFLDTMAQPQERRTPYMSLKAAISFTLLAWSTYYFNRPYYSNLASLWALYSVLILDGLRVLKAGLRGRRRMWTGAILFALVLMSSIVPHALKNYRDSQPSYNAIWSQFVARLNHSPVAGATPGLVVTGVKMPEPLARFLIDKSDGLKQFSQANNDDLRYVTIHSMLVPKMSTIGQKLPHIDPYFGLLFRKQYEGFLYEIQKPKARYILLDDVVADPVMKDAGWHAELINNIELSLKDTYTFQKSEHGWRIWKRRDS